MIIRELQFSDKSEVDHLYNRFFSDNEYPDFWNPNGTFQCSFVVTDDKNDDKIILACGIKTIVEAVIVSDKNRSVRTRQEALVQALGSAILITTEMKHKQIHAFVGGDEDYVKHLQKYGFKLLDAKLLVLDCGVPHG